MFEIMVERRGSWRGWRQCGTTSWPQRMPNYGILTASFS